MSALLLTVCHRLAEAKPPSFLLYANCEDEKSLLKVVCNKQRGLKSQIVVKGDGIFIFWGQSSACAECCPGALQKALPEEGLGTGWERVLGHHCGLEKIAAFREDTPEGLDLGLKYLLWACG